MNGETIQQWVDLITAIGVAIAAIFSAIALVITALHGRSLKTQGKSLRKIELATNGMQAELEAFAYRQGRRDEQEHPTPSEESDA